MDGELSAVLTALKAWGPTGISGGILFFVRKAVEKIADHETRISKIEGVCQERGRLATEDK